MVTTEPSASHVAPGTTRIVPYDHARHAGGPWNVIATVFREYGFEFQVDGYDRDVQEPHVYFAPGAFAVAEDAEGRVVGCTGFADLGGGVFELKRLYVLAEARRGGIGQWLVEWVLRETRARGARRVVLYSDTNFVDAHRLYRRMGFRNNRFRYADDPWRSPEWGFVLDFPEEAR
ncbi:MAG: GNAT family N-acetyltransferase [Hyphomicrobiales bacterium]